MHLNPLNIARRDFYKRRDSLGHPQQSACKMGEFSSGILFCARNRYPIQSKRVATTLHKNRSRKITLGRVSQIEDSPGRTLAILQPRSGSLCDVVTARSVARA